MATNTLFYTWTIKKSFVKDTPKNVKDTITSSCNWLNDNVLSGKYETMNAFFSGSIKDDVSLLHDGVFSIAFITYYIAVH